MSEPAVAPRPDTRPPRRPRGENEARLTQILEEAATARDYYRFPGDIAINAFLAGEIQEIPGTSWLLPYGACYGEGISDGH